jgi:hypothetical protein
MSPAIFLLGYPRASSRSVGADAIAGRFEGWFGSATDFTVLSTGNQEVAGRSLLQWRFRLHREGRTPEVIEQVAFVDAGPDGVHRLDLLCSGFLPEADLVLSCDIPARTVP